MRRLYPKVSYVVQASITNQLSFSTASGQRMESESSERERECELRRQVLYKYNGVKIPELVSFNYGHFSSVNINLSATQYALRDADDSFNSNILPNNSSKEIRRMIWLMILSGLTLIYFLRKVVLQTSRGLNDLELPLWLASIERQSKHIIFLIQFDEQTRIDLRKEFESVHFLNPFIDFFDWVKTKRPEFGLGIRYDPGVSIGILLTFLANTESHVLTIFIRSIQMASLKRNVSPMQRLDEFIDHIRFSGSVTSGTDNMKAFDGENVVCSKAASTHLVKKSTALSETHSVNTGEIFSIPKPDPHETNPFRYTYPDGQCTS
ncbi:unnamed protein product [Phytomonas sp. EM1]|nr:unnamed protein product [Phytomonas sp. EM1]|eukprot:CCW64555.1 unnamed protein product [Phytomonas sp. isolate EM1]